MIIGKKIKKAFEKISREEFIPQEYRFFVDNDAPIDIGYEQTTSQPSLIAHMISLLKPNKNKVILEIGTGSGYEASILSQLVKKVYSIEIIPQLADRARKIVEKIGIKNLEIITGDGSKGLVGHSPFDGIIVAAAAPKIPQTLVNQLKEGGIMVIPIKQDGFEVLTVGTKINGKLITKEDEIVRFVPLVGEFGYQN